MSGQFGLGYKTIDLIHEVLKNHPLVIKAVIYGSRAKDNYREGSDIDLTLHGKNISNRELASILDELDDLLLPYTFDLSVYDSLKNDKLIEHINRVGRIFYEKTTDTNSLPTGWEIRTIGDVCVSASSNVSQNTLADDKGDYPIFGASGIIKKVSFYHQEKPYLSIVKDGSGVGRVTKMDAYTSVIGTLQYILPKENVDLDYLNYFFISVDFKKYVAGAAIPHIYFKDYKNEPFLWMPLPEQQRIVFILDEAFAAIAKAKANVEQNLKNAKELFESYLQGVFETKGDDWETKKLNEITKVKDGTHDSPKYIKEGIPFVTQKNIKPHGLSFDDTKFITDADHEKFYKRSNVAYGDIIISMIGANRGMTAIVDDKRIFSIKNVGLIKSSDNINMNYLLYYLKSVVAMKYVLYMSNGGAQEFVGLTALRSFPIPYPSLNEQDEIVKKLDVLRAETQKLEVIYQKKLDDLEELKKSILQKAFTGELPSPEGGRYINYGGNPSNKKATTTTSSERA